MYKEERENQMENCHIINYTLGSAMHACMSVVFPVFTISIFHEFCILDERKGEEKTQVTCLLSNGWSLVRSGRAEKARTGSKRYPVI